MPRGPRIIIEDGVYHVITRGNSDISILKNGEDKEKYIGIVKKYQDIYKFKVFVFCIMETHAHFIIDPNGADLSIFMHGINGSYAQYYNSSRIRHGHVFDDRFKSIPICEENYLLTSSLYIHNNPKDIKEYRDKIQEYKYSSISQYIDDPEYDQGLLKVDNEVILQILSNDIINSKSTYRYLLKLKGKKELPKVDMELNNLKTRYVSGKNILNRNINPKSVIEFVAEHLDMKPVEIYIKYKRKPNILRALSVLIMRGYCDLSIEEVASVLGNVTSSDITFLCNKGYNLVNSKEIYSDILDKFIQSHYKL